MLPAGILRLSALLCGAALLRLCFFGRVWIRDLFLLDRRPANVSWQHVAATVFYAGAFLVESFAEPVICSPYPFSTVRLADTADRAMFGVPVATASGRVVQLMLSSCHYAANSRPRRRGPGALRRRATPPELWVVGWVQFVELNVQFLIVLSSTA